MDVKDIATLVTAIAALVGAFGALVNAVRTNHIKKEFSHNHGSSMKDAITRIESRQKGLIKTTELLANGMKSLGHQVGEIRNDANIAHEDYAARLRRLESDK